MSFPKYSGSSRLFVDALTMYCRNYDGDMTIDLSTGLSVRIPNDQIITPHVDYDRNGSRVFNDSERDMLMTGLSQNTITLGRYFLTSAYLMVDYDSNQFTMWNANPTTLSSLKPVINAASSELCLPIDGDASEEYGEEGLTVGMIVGIVVGCIAITVVTLVGGTLIWQRKVSRRRPPLLARPSEEQSGAPYELSNANNPTSVRSTQSFWPSKETTDRAELHETYLQLSTAGRHELKAARLSVNPVPNKVYYEMLDSRQLPRSPLVHDQGSLA